jgi:hypothetical protein
MDRALGDQMAAQGRRVQQLDATGVICPLHASSLPDHSHPSWDLHEYLLSTLLAGEPQRHILGLARLLPQKERQELARVLLACQ